MSGPNHQLDGYMTSSSVSGSHHDLPPLAPARSSIHDVKKVENSFTVEEARLEAVTTRSSKIDVGYPEGGPQATRTTLGAFFVLFVQFGLMNSFGVFEAQYSTVNLRSKSPSDIAWIGTFQFFMFFFSGAFVGRFFDSFGAKPLLLPGTVLLVLSLIATSYCYEYYQFFLAQGLLFGVGASLTFYPALSSLTHWYEQKRGRIMGLVTAGSSLGGVVFPIALNKLIPAVGFPMAVRIIASIAAGILLPAGILIRTRLPRRPFNKDVSSLVDVEGFKDLGYTLFLAASVITMLGTYNPYIFVTVYSESRHFSPTISTYILSIMNVGSFFGRLIPGILADKLGFFNILSIALTIAGPVLFCWLAVSSAAEYVVWTAFYGFFSGAFIALLPACIGKFTPDPTKYGGRAGMVFAFVGLAVLCGPPIAGALIARDHGKFTEMIVYSGVMCVAGAALYWLARFRATNGKIFIKF
ncbi:MFS general substrate transporter [Marasmius fiardii PR-910]|nr:MFS general substrate transporter [Marasmius fiardii PR-910]